MGFWRSLASSGTFHWPLCVTPSTIDRAISANNATNRILRTLKLCWASIVLAGSSRGLQLSCGRILRAENQPDQFGVEKKNRGRHHPGDDGSGARVHQLAHLLTVCGELNERNHREGQLKAEHHLAE